VHSKSTPICHRSKAGVGPAAGGEAHDSLRADTEDISLLTVQPPREDGEHQLERGGVDHRASLYHDDQSCRRASIQSWDSTAFNRCDTLGSTRVNVKRIPKETTVRVFDSAAAPVSAAPISSRRRLKAARDGPHD
jgi:hypothetical protein